VLAQRTAVRVGETVPIPLEALFDDERCLGVRRESPPPS
jgi:hypothetical protein